MLSIRKTQITVETQVLLWLRISTTEHYHVGVVIMALEAVIVILCTDSVCVADRILLDVSVCDVVLAITDILTVDVSILCL